jgi:hypothetical protein
MSDCILKTTIVHACTIFLVFIKMMRWSEHRWPLPHIIFCYLIIVISLAGVMLMVQYHHLHVFIFSSHSYHFSFKWFWLRFFFLRTKWLRCHCGLLILLFIQIWELLHLLLTPTTITGYNLEVGTSLIEFWITDYVKKIPFVCGKSPITNLVKLRIVKTYFHNKLIS